MAFAIDIPIGSEDDGSDAVDTDDEEEDVEEVGDDGAGEGEGAPIPLAGTDGGIAEEASAPSAGGADGGDEDVEIDEAGAEDVSVADIVSTISVELAVVLVGAVEVGRTSFKDIG